MKITILAIERVMPSVIFGMFDMFSLAIDWWGYFDGQGPPPEFQLEIVTEGGRPVSSFNRIDIQPDRAMEVVQDTDVVVIPALIPPLESMLEQSGNIIEWLRQRHEQGTLLVSVCTGAFLLAEAGLLNGKTATTHWKAAARFRQRYPEVTLKPQCLVVDEGDIITSGGVSAHFDLSLYLLEKYTTHKLSSICAKMMVVDPERVSQVPYTIFDYQRGHFDPVILTAQEWMEAHFAENLSIEAVAGTVGLGTRNFIRRFKKATGDTPLTYLQRLRIEEAKHHLETTRKNVDEITFLVGYEDSSSFVRLFKKYAGLPPGAYRSKFSRLAFAET